MIRENLLYDILDQLTPVYYELKNFIVDMPNELKETFLGLVITLAVNSDNPYTSMRNSRQTLRKNTKFYMMLNNVTSFLNSQLISNNNINFHSTKELLKYILKVEE
jgi:uncharacterized pyridoxamine 5'-phosphate oxidase family protein